MSVTAGGSVPPPYVVLCLDRELSVLLTLFWAAQACQPSGSGACNRFCSPFVLSLAILGMHTLMSNQQYYEALGSSTIVNKEGLNSK